MKMKSYGITSEAGEMSDIDKYLEEFEINGFAIIPNLLDEKQLKTYREKLDAVYAKQEKEFGKENLEKINELNMTRAPLVEDEAFLELATHKLIMEIVAKVLGNYFLLHLQNGIINKPNLEHHQSSWHRDLPYQDWVISKPIAMNAFWCLDPFNEKTGGTVVLPHSHRVDHMPSEHYVQKFEKGVVADPGSVILFDSMLYHRAGYNSSDIIRRGINNVYVAPFLKQQIDLPTALDGKYADDEFLNKFLGYGSKVKGSVDEYRQSRLDRLK